MNNFNLIKEPAEEFSKLKEAIRSRLADHLYDEAMEIIEQTTQTCFNFKIVDVGKLGKEELLIFLSEHRQLNLFEILMMAELFALEGEIFMKNKFFPESKNSYENAENLFEYLSNLTGETFPIEFQQMRARIKLSIRDINLILSK